MRYLPSSYSRRTYVLLEVNILSELVVIVLDLHLFIFVEIVTFVSNTRLLYRHVLRDDNVSLGGEK